MADGKKADEKKGWKISRRRMLLGSAVGVLLGTNVVMILVKNSKNKAESFTLQFTGPFNYSESVPFKTPKDAPVNIDYIRFTEKGNGNYLTLGFTFNGKKDPLRVINLIVDVKNSSGKIIAKDEVPCHDARIPTTSTMGGAACLQNCVNADLGHINPDQIAMLEVKFTQ